MIAMSTLTELSGRCCSMRFMVVNLFALIKQPDTKAYELSKRYVPVRNTVVPSFVIETELTVY